VASILHQDRDDRQANVVAHSIEKNSTAQNCPSSLSEGVHALWSLAIDTSGVPRMTELVYNDVKRLGSLLIGNALN
jgi:hypothetical protein